MHKSLCNAVYDVLTSCSYNYDIMFCSISMNTVEREGCCAQIRPEISRHGSRCSRCASAWREGSSRRSRAILERKVFNATSSLLEVLS